MRTLTKELNTLSSAPVDFDVETITESFKRVGFETINALDFLIQAHITSFGETGDFRHYSTAAKLKKHRRDLIKNHGLVVK